MISVRCLMLLCLVRHVGIFPCLVLFRPATLYDMILVGSCLVLAAIFFSAHFYFPASSYSGQAVVTGVVPSSPGSCLQLLPRIGFSNPTARRFFIECC